MGPLGLVACFTKLPLAGLTKTRLIPALGAQQAAELHRCFLMDTVESLLKLDFVELLLFVDGDPRHACLEEIVGMGATRVVEQGGGDLGDRLEAAFAHATREECPIVIVGSDSPTLPSSYVDEALTRLQKSDVVLGPASDGGYYLIGVRPGVALDLSKVRWSTDAAFEDTRDSVLHAGLRLSVLAPWYDVDTPEDLRVLKIHLQAQPGIATRTALHFDQVSASH